MKTKIEKTKTGKRLIMNYAKYSDDILLENTIIIDGKKIKYGIGKVVIQPGSSKDSRYGVKLIQTEFVWEAYAIAKLFYEGLYMGDWADGLYNNQYNKLYFEIEPIEPVNNIIYGISKSEFIPKLAAFVAKKR